MKTRLPWMPAALYRSLHPTEQAFYDVAHRYFEDIFHYNPVYATWAGDRLHDHRLGTARNALMQAPASLDIRCLDYLIGAERHEEHFSDDGWVDYWAFRTTLDIEMQLDRWQLRRRDLSITLEVVADSIDLLLAQTSGRLDEHRLQAVLSRLRQIPRTLQAERRDRKKAVAYWAELAIETAEGVEVYLNRLFGRLGHLKDIRLQRELKQLRPQVMAELARHQDWLEAMLDHAADEFAAGDKLLTAVIQVAHGINKTPEGVARLGYRLIHETEQELQAEAEKLDWRYWRELLEVVRQRSRPEGPDIKQHYSREVAAIRAFLARRNLVSLPANEELTVVDTPPHFEQFVPSAAYLPPGPFQRVCRGQFYVSGPSSSLTRRSRLRCLDAHAASHLTAAHEGYPGHHLQLTVAAQHPRKLRAMLDSPYLSEGWGLYCEQLIEEQGYRHGRYDRFLRLADQLWRAWRIVIDVRLHQGKWSPERCAAILVAEANFEPERARREINWYTQRPGYPMAYLLGKERIIELREEALERGMGLKQFHDRLLGFGSVSPDVTAQVLFR